MTKTVSLVAHWDHDSRRIFEAKLLEIKGIYLALGKLKSSFGGQRSIQLSYGRNPWMVDS